MFLAKWSEAFESGSTQVKQLLAQRSLLFVVSKQQPWPLDGLPPPSENTRPWLAVYLWISLGSAAVTLIHLCLGFYTSLQASRKLFRKMLLRLVRAPSRFFDTTPLGRVRPFFLLTEMVS